MAVITAFEDLYRQATGLSGIRDLHQAKRSLIILPKHW
jgi:hypothetical protein